MPRARRRIAKKRTSTNILTIISQRARHLREKLGLPHPKPVVKAMHSTSNSDINSRPMFDVIEVAKFNSNTDVPMSDAIQPPLPNNDISPPTEATPPVVEPASKSTINRHSIQFLLLPIEDESVKDGGNK
jgi:hypothetical protein